VIPPSGPRLGRPARLRPADRTEEVPRTSAALTDTLPETGERAPIPVPESSAEEIDGIDPAADRFGIGQPATEQEIAAVDIDAMPDGRGLPDGHGTFAEGEEVYAQHCASCHGEDLEGMSEIGAPRLIGGRGTLDSDAPVRTVESYWPHASAVYDYVHRAMPLQAPGSLEPDQVYAVTAYILGRAGIVDEDVELDRETLAEIEMPNADGFASDPRPDVE
jgi:S-disulfanyl-L-cysteine oxidoreductase SoxD